MQNVLELDRSDGLTVVNVLNATEPHLLKWLISCLCEIHFNKRGHEPKDKRARRSEEKKFAQLIIYPWTSLRGQPITLKTDKQREKLRIYPAVLVEILFHGRS